MQASWIPSSKICQLACLFYLACKSLPTVFFIMLCFILFISTLTGKNLHNFKAKFPIKFYSFYSKIVPVCLMIMWITKKWNNDHHNAYRNGNQNCQIKKHIFSFYLKYCWTVRMETLFCWWSAFGHWMKIFIHHWVSENFYWYHHYSCRESVFTCLTPKFEFFCLQTELISMEYLHTNIISWCLFHGIWSKFL